jgi:hypothetical protein
MKCFVGVHGLDLEFPDVLSDRVACLQKFTAVVEDKRGLSLH